MSLADFEIEADRCSQCSSCKWIPYDRMQSWRFAKNCPSVAYFNFNAYSARGRYAVTRSLVRGWSAITDETRDVALSCLACGACDVSCKVCRHNLEPLDMVRELKAHVVEQGHASPGMCGALASVARTGNPMGHPKARRGDWAEGLDVPRLPAAGERVLFFAGCQFSYDPELRASARATVEILRRGGVAVGILGAKEMCCGGRWYAAGHRDEFRRLATANLRAWDRAGIRKIVTPCSDCFHAFNRLYPELGGAVEAVHAVQLVARLADEGRLPFRSSVPMKVTYHDPCHLGRQGEPYVPWRGVERKILGQVVVHDPPKPRYNGAHGVYDEPRRLLASIPGIELVEMERIRESAWCCGAGGGVREAYPEMARWTAAERLDEARATGAEALVTACPWCERSFLDAAGDGGRPIRVIDIMSLVRQALDGTEAA